MSFWNNLINGPIHSDPLTEDIATTSRTVTSLTDRAARLRKVVGGTAKPKLIDEVNDLGAALGHTFTSTGLPNMLSELERVVLGLKADSVASSPASDVSTIVEGIAKMRDDIGLPVSSASTSTEESLKELETSIFGSSKEGAFLERVVALRKEIYGSP